MSKKIPTCSNSALDAYVVSCPTQTKNLKRTLTRSTSAETVPDEGYWRLLSLIHSVITFLEKNSLGRKTKKHKIFLMAF